ncbi:glycine cleavage system aminomethyltransferase GcvT [Brevibacterium litoralis]|uniref:glycine cleavage system aminomethyltransferase GcvT n=1 Tax=Brevibacterium litoralis TaxID=3138935 RepID=UPI0032EE1E28
MTDPKHTALRAVHAELGANFTDFGGWDMPLKYGSELAEHRAVRSTAGLFDLSHMGEVRVTGADAAAFLDHALVTVYSAMKVGKAKYGVIVDRTGHVLDDLITYRISDDEFLVVPNAGNAAVVAAALTERAEEFRTGASGAGTATEAPSTPGADVTVRDESAGTSLVAVQGPASEAIVLAALDAGVDPERVTGLGYYAWAPVVIAGVDVMLARTGYTGEDGFELYVPNEAAVTLWQALVAAGEGHELVPCGLAARDSLRLEAGMPLYGHELTVETSPVDAGLGKMVERALEKKGDFFAREALESFAGSTPARVLVGLSSEGRRAAREGAAVMIDGAEVGVVTSGQPSPTLGHPIALAYLDTAHAEAGTAVSVDIRGKAHDFRVVDLPFYRRS